MNVPSRFEELAGNELQLLALLSRPSLTKGQAEFVKSRLPIVNISKLNELVAHHRVWPSVYCNTQDNFADQFPEGFALWLKKKYQSSLNQSRNQFIVQSQVIALLKRSGIRSVSLKGASIAEKLYGDLAKRQSNDIDILIRHDDLARAHQVLVDKGYTCAIYEEMTQAQRKVYFDAHKDLPYISPNGLLIELHIRLSGHSMPLTNHVKQSLLDKDSVSEIEEFLYLCWHGSHTLYHRLKWLVDMALYIEKQEGIDKSFLDKVLVASKRLDCERSLVLSHVLFETSLPDSALKSFEQDRVTQWMVKKSLKNKRGR